VEWTMAESSFRFVDMFDSKKVKDLLPMKMGRFRPTRKLSKILVK
jgi:hypothetical protein